MAQGVDDVTGTGPEVLQYDIPYGAGPFLVKVFDFGVDSPVQPNPATMRIYLDGTLEAELHATFLADEDYIDFASINALTGQIVDLTP